MSDHNEDLWIVAIRGDELGHAEDKVFQTAPAACKHMAREIGSFVNGDWSDFPPGFVPDLKAAIESGNPYEIARVSNEYMDLGEFDVLVTKEGVTYAYDIDEPDMKWPEGVT